MKFTTLATVAAVATITVAQPHAHRHKHRHAHPVVKRQATVTSSVPGTTATAFVLANGTQISVEEVCQGLSDNLLKFADGAVPSGLCGSAAPTSTAAAWAGVSGLVYPQNNTSTSTTPSTASALSASSAPSAAWSNVPASGGSGATGVTTPFPDGTIDCSVFPSAYGAVPLPYLGMGGWSGLQSVTLAGSSFTNIVTGVSGSTCSEGMMCSYACPAGYQKSQWPSQQGSTGQSVGGIQCTGGKLHLTNPSLSNNLCIPGVGGVSAQNNAGSVVAICRTDYPGTESETIPVEVQPGSTEELACPNAATYYSWEDKSTSAQYYLNPIGVPASKACQWGSSGSDMGNWAPINFGVGSKDGTTWLSIFQNAPTTQAQYQGTVSISGNVSGGCKYSNGQYCDNSGNCNANGCTVSVLSGEATFVISS